MQWWLPHLTQAMKQRPSTVMGVPQQKCPRLSNVSWAPSISSSLTTSHDVAKSAYSLRKHGNPLLLKGGPRGTEVLSYSYRPPHGDWADHASSPGTQVWGRWRPLHSFNPRRAGTLSSMKMKRGPVMVMQRHNDQINDVILVEWPRKAWI